MNSKPQEIMKAARLIARAENVAWHVALSWAHQAHAEWQAKEDAWRRLEERAELLRKHPGAAKRAKVGGVRVYGCPKPATQRAIERRQKAEAALPPLVSADEYWRKQRAKREAHKPRSGEGPRVAA